MRADHILPDASSHVHRDGLAIRKGTVAAFLHNARLLADRSTSPAERRQAEQDVAADLPALQALGLFEVLSIRDAGVRALVTRLAAAPVG